MTPRFKKAMPYVFMHEGGYNNKVNDKGGATNYGISLLFLKGVKEDLNHDGKVDYLDIKGLKQAEAEKLYFKHFWRALYDELKYERLAIKLFDTAINMGHFKAHSLLQRAIKAMGSVIIEDGDIGPKTLGLVNKYAENQLLDTYCKVQDAYYKAIIKNNPSQAEFAKGWANRAKWLPKV